MDSIVDDIQLARGIRNGDKVAFRVFFDRYYQPLLAYISAFHHSTVEAEDLVQQAFATLWIQRAQLDPAQSPKGYLYAVAYRNFIDQKRKRQLNTEYIDDIKQEALQVPLSESDDTVERNVKKVMCIIDNLPHRCREILLLSKIHGLQYKEIAQKLDISIKTVESQMRIAYIKIREKFEEE